MAKDHLPDLDHVTTINEDGSRYFLHPSDVKGLFTWLRIVFAFLLVTFYVLAPWIQINGFPAVFLDVYSKRFHLFGFTLAPQDFWLFFFLITGTAFSLFFITALIGRFWCGWTCPHSVFLEQVYRRIERLIEGDANKRRNLDLAPWTSIKVTKRIIKHTLFFIISALIAHIFLSYFVSLPQLYQWIQKSPDENWKAFVFVFALSAALHVNFAWFREQLCIVICPYGRLQSVLIDDDSITVGYDGLRGEPRGKLRDKEAGDCIDCKRCVQVCPTGIDIRQGLQMECIACANCIDACNEIMTKVGRSRHLIKYASHNQLKGNKKLKLIRPRTLLYSLFLLIGCLVMSTALFQVTPANAFASRMQGMPFYLDDETIRNQFFIRLVNKQNHPLTLQVSVESPIGELERHGFESRVEIPPMGEETGPIVMLLPRHAYTGRFTTTLVITDMDNSFRIERSVEFIGPDMRLMPPKP